MVAPTPAGAADWQKHHAELEKEQADLEEKLAHVSRDQRHSRGAGLTPLPWPPPCREGTALVEVVAYDHWGPKADHPKADGKVEWQREECLAAFVVTHGHPPVRVSLGSSCAVEHAATAWRRTPRPGCRGGGREVGPARCAGRAQPVAASTCMVRRPCWWPPTGCCATCPWPPCPARCRANLLEEVAIVHLGHGREVVQEKPAAPAGKGLRAGRAGVRQARWDSGDEPEAAGRSRPG